MTFGEFPWRTQDGQHDNHLVLFDIWTGVCGGLPKEVFWQHQWTIRVDDDLATVLECECGFIVKSLPRSGLRQIHEMMKKHYQEVWRPWHDSQVAKMEFAP